MRNLYRLLFGKQQPMLFWRISDAHNSITMYADGKITSNCFHRNFRDLLEVIKGLSFRKAYRAAKRASAAYGLQIDRMLMPVSGSLATA